MPAKVEIGDLGRSPFRLGEWLVEPSLNRVSRGDTTIQLELKVMDVLVCLAERAGEVVTRFEIIDRVWATEFIADNTLTHAINEIRTALGDDARNPSFIETIHRRGYRLMVAVELEQRPAGAVAQFPSRAQVVVDDNRSPYPGLAAFTEADAEFFFGREAEVAQMWRKLTSRRLLAVIGPSGVGKSSFLRAGVIPAKPEGWGVLVCQPGEAPFAALARALLPEFRDNPEALSKATEFEANATSLFTRWRERHDRALLIVDQFEELFTLNTPDVQARYASLIGSLAREADLHVVLAMRDDFLYRCHALVPLRPILEDLSALAQPDSEALRRALTEPARHLGFTFEDEKLAEEMVAEVEGERGALPMLAFAAARLWEKRDREMRQLTRQAYQDIGGVAGALARHAEATLEGIGGDRLPIVREIFRNMVTAEGTRAVREWNELLSVFPDSRAEAAAAVLRTLIDARLLTSYEVREEDREPCRRVEIIHESLLVNWPRLVGWQTQDADAARIRDELRQAAKTWEDHERTNDLLWTGAAFREFRIWHDRYPGGLTEVEEAFAVAMTSFAAWRRRRRRIFVSAVIVILLSGLVVVGSFWRRSVLETRRAEAQKFVALAQAQMQEYPTAALAHATRSLELVDDDQARFLALKALWQGPTAFVVNETPSTSASFSPDGRWMVQEHDRLSSLAVISQTGEQQALNVPMNTGKTRLRAFFGSRSDLFLTLGSGTDQGRLGLWSAPQRRLLANARPIDDPVANPRGFAIAPDQGDGRSLFVMGLGHLFTIEALYPDGRYERLGQYRTTAPIIEGDVCMPKASGEWFGILDDNRVSAVDIGRNGLSESRFLGSHDGNLGLSESIFLGSNDGNFVSTCLADDRGRFFLTFDKTGKVKRWDPTGKIAPASLKLPSASYSWGFIPLFLHPDGFLVVISLSAETSSDALLIFALDESGIRLLRRIKSPKTNFPAFDPHGLRIAMRGPLPAHRLWDFGGPAGAEPATFKAGPERYVHRPSFSPDGQWVTTSGSNGTKIWPLARNHPSVISVGVTSWSAGVAFPTDGRFLATSAGSEVRVWPLEGRVPPEGTLVIEAEGLALSNVAVSPEGGRFAVGTGSGRAAVLLGTNGKPPRNLPTSKRLIPGTGMVTFSPDGSLVSAADGGYDLANGAFHVWEVSTGEEVAVLRIDGEEIRYGSRFTDDGRLLTGFTSGVVAWDIESGERELVIELPLLAFVASDDGRRLVALEEGTAGVSSQAPKGSPIFFDLDSGETTELTGHGKKVVVMALNADGTVVATGDSDGIVRVGPVDSEQPHLLLGHEGSVLRWCLGIDPKGRWIASCGMDETLRLWPMPDLSKPPLHTLPHDELIAKLKTLTNLRVVRDEDSSTGWKLTHDPFPGWETVPTW